MTKRSNWPGIVLTLLALALIYGVGTTLFTVELERLVERTITPHMAASKDVEAMNREVYSGIDRFLASKHVRILGYACFALVVLLALAGLIIQKRQLAFLGSVGFTLPIYAYFVLHMSFLTALWAPFWGNVVRLGDIAYVPYMFMVYPLSLVGVDVRQSLAGLFMTLGLLVFVLGVLAWFYAQFQRKGTADFWIYRFTRHPQYLGWIVWSYGLMLRVALRRDTVLHQANPGASLPWAVSTLIIICIALSEEIRMHRQEGEEYARYSGSAPFLLPLPGAVSRAIAAPFRVLRGKERPETGWDVARAFAIYLALVCLLSLPFVVLDWPSGGSWVNWPL